MVVWCGGDGDRGGGEENKSTSVDPKATCSSVGCSFSKSSVCPGQKDRERKKHYGFGESMRNTL